MMRALNEFIARKAKKEDKVRGRFWEGRFKSQALADEEGLLTCMAYVDLNPVRAGLASSLEASDFTSIQERLQDLAKKAGAAAQANGAQSSRALCRSRHTRTEHPRRPMNVADYVELVEWTDRILAKDKRAKITGQPTLLRECGISVAGRLHALSEHRVGLVSFIGSVQSFGARCESRNST